MSVSGYLWFSEDGVPAGVSLRRILAAMEIPPGVVLGPDSPIELYYGRNTASFDSVQVYVAADESSGDEIPALLFDRPLQRPEFLETVFRVMGLGHAMYFYTDDTTPIFRDAEAIKHFDHAFITSLGTPRIVSSPDGLLHGRI